MLKVVTSETKGRCFYTRQKVKKGDVLLKSEPFGLIVDQDSLTRVCSCCVKEPLSLDQKLTLTCQECQYVYYCSTECCKQDWDAYHQFECGFALPETLSSYQKDYLRLLIRLLIKYKLEPRHLELKHVHSLCHNISALSNTQIEEFKQGAEILGRFLTKLDFVLPKVDSSVSALIQSRISLESKLEPLFLLIAQEESNSFGLYTFNYLGCREPRQGFGLALYPTAVYFNHSCAPNVGHAYQNNTMEFFALEDIDADSECMISYVHLNTDKKQRKKILEELFYFSCCCELCSSEGSGIPKGGSCKKDDCQGYLVPKSGAWNCVGCGIQTQ